MSSIANRQMPTNPEFISVGIGAGNVVTFSAAGLTENRVQALPNKPGTLAIQNADGRISGITGGTATGEVMTQDQFGANSSKLTPDGYGIPAFAAVKLFDDQGTYAHYIRLQAVGDLTNDPEFDIDLLNGSKTLQLGADLRLPGAFDITLRGVNNADVTLPTTGTLLATPAIGVTVAAHAAINADIAALSSNGLIARTGSGTVAARSIAVGSASLTVSNADGASGNPTLNTAQDIRTTATNFTVAGATVNGALVVTGNNVLIDNNKGYRIKASGGSEINVLTIDTSNNLASVAGPSGSLTFYPDGGNNGAALHVANAAGSGSVVIGSTTLPTGAKNNLTLAGATRTLGAATADMVSLAAPDKSAGDARFRVQTEAGGWMGLGNNCVEALNAIGLEPNNPQNGQRMSVDSLTELTTIAAAAFTDTTIQWPANCIRIGVSTRVTTTIPIVGTYSVGNAATPTLYATGVSAGAGNTHPGTNGMPLNQATAAAVRITPSATPDATTGRIRVTLHFLTITPPTS